MISGWVSNWLWSFISAKIDVCRIINKALKKCTISYLLNNKDVCLCKNSRYDPLHSERSTLYWTKEAERIRGVRQYSWIGTADIRSLCERAQQSRTALKNVGEIDPPRCWGSVDSCQRAGVQLRGRFQQIFAAMKRLERRIMSARTFQDIDLRLRGCLHRFREISRGWVRHERHDDPQFRSG